MFPLPNFRLKKNTKQNIGCHLKRWVHVAGVAEVIFIAESWEEGKEKNDFLHCEERPQPLHVCLPLQVFNILLLFVSHLVHEAMKRH